MISILSTEQIEQFDKDGFLVLDIFSNAECELVNQDIIKRLSSNSKVKLNPKIYHYNESPRIIEAWKWSNNIKNIALSPIILKALKQIWSANPIPFSTINFLRGTEQPLHSDAFHFGSEKMTSLAGVWTALEDIKKGSGELTVVPGSHKYPYVDCGELNCPIPKSKKDIKDNNTTYEKYVKDIIRKMNGKIYCPNLSKGQVLLWAANLLHGAKPINDKSLSRLSMVTHYHFDDSNYYTNPNFSSAKDDIIAYRHIEESIIDK